MALLLILGKFDPKVWLRELKKIDAELDIRIWPEIGNPNDIDFALVWTYPPGELLSFPNLKCISSLGAGVDHIFNDPDRPKHVPVVRVIDKLLARDMTQYVALAVLNYTRLVDLYQQQQQRQEWKQHSPKNELTVGIMGLGELGKDAAEKLIALRFNVIGWSRTPKNLSNLKCYYGEEQFQQFLSESPVLINLLPLTPATKNILNKETFSHLPKGAYIINVARGGHLVEQDLIAALDQEQLSGACLDVFTVEPLPKDHPFWHHPKIRVTPHIASVTNPKSVAAQIIENYQRMKAGKPLLHQVNLETGY